MTTPAKTRGPGRPANPKTVIDVPVTLDPRAFLESVMNGGDNDAKLRIDAAKALMPYHHKRLGEAGKKEQAAEAASKAATGKFGAASAPRVKRPGA